jgi:5-methylcytosine-specific restriction protein B
MDELVEAVCAPYESGAWAERIQEAFGGLFGSSGGRYRKHAASKIRVRAPSDASPPFAALIHESNPDSGAYGGMSFVVFPAKGQPERPAMFGLVLGTQGLSPDEDILARPGHARKANAMVEWLNDSLKGDRVAWAKDDPVRLDQEVPHSVQSGFAEFSPVFDRYGEEIYAFVAPEEEGETVETALKAFLDLMFEERGESPLSSAEDEAERIKRQYHSRFFPTLTDSDASEVLAERQYAIVQGPPGTGKTRLARRMLQDRYDGRGMTVQFHPSTTYEDVIGGLAPVKSEGAAFGFQFEPEPGALMTAAAKARQTDKPFLLHIDEINRADLANVLGEAVFLLEPDADDDRSVTLSHDYGEPFGTDLTLPENLHILGTMNTSDRSIAILDVAIRRRFAFLKLWPQLQVVREHACELMEQKFRELQSIFVEHATDDAFNLMPGHSYFLELDEDRARRKLKQELAPLLEEYLRQGYVGGFEGEIRSYLQSVASL